MRFASALGLLLLLAASPPVAAAPLNQCLPTRCVDGIDAGQACRENADCDLEEPGDGLGTCGEEVSETPQRVFVVNRFDDRLCDADDPRTCACPETTPDDAASRCALSDCSLREAVVSANLTPNDPIEGFEGVFQPDIIRICPGTVVLEDGGEDEDEAKSGDLDVLESVSISALPDEDATTTGIRGGTDRVLHVHAPASETDPLISVNLLRLTVEQGGDPDGFDADGGAILNEAAILISRVILRDNAVAAGDGGAVHTGVDGETTIDLTTMLDNQSTAGNGGAVSNAGLLSSLNSTYTGNQAGGNGGAFYNTSAQETLSALFHVTISANDAAGEGDGLYNAGNEFVLISVLIDQDGCAHAVDSPFRSDGGNVESPGQAGVATCFPPTCNSGLDAGQVCTTDSDCDLDSEGDGAGSCDPLPRCLGGLDDGELCAVDADCDLVDPADGLGTCSQTPDQVAPAGSLLEPLDTSGIPFFPLALGVLDPKSPDRNRALDLGSAPCQGTDQRSSGRPYDAYGDGGNDCDAGSYEARRPRADKTAMVLEDDDGDGKPEPGETLRYTVTVVNDEELFTSGDPLLFTFSDSLDPDLTATLIAGSVVPDNGDVVEGNGLGDPGDPGNPDDDIPPDSAVLIQNAEISGDGPWTVTYDVLIDPDLPDTVSQVVNQGGLTFQGVCVGGLDDGAICLRDLDCDLVDADDGLGTCGGQAYPTSIPSDDPDTVAVEDETIVQLASAPRVIACKEDSLEVDLLENGEFNPGDTIRYVVVLTNEGEQPAVGAVFEDTPPRDSTLVAGSVTLEIDDVPFPDAITTGNDEGDTSVRVEFDRIDERAGDTAVITFDVRINDPIPLGCTDFFNVGMVSGENFPTVFTDDPATTASPDETRSQIVFSPIADERTRYKVKLDFRRADRDKLRLRVKNFEIPVPVGAGTQVIVDQGDVHIAGELDEKGRFRSEAGGRTDTIRLKQHTKKVKDAEGTVSEVGLYKLLVKSKQADLSEGLAPFGLVDADVEDAVLGVDTRIRIGSDCLDAEPEACFDTRANIPVVYNARAGRKGKGKTAVQTLPNFDCPLLRPPVF